MRHDKVGTVMATDVVRAEYGTPFKEVALLLATHRISGVPVVDEDDKVIGVLSETDLIMHQATTPDPYETKHRASLAELTPGARRQAAKGRARTAGELMTRPPVTVHADDTIVPSIALLTTEHDRRVDRLRAGQALERLWLVATAYGLRASVLDQAAEWDDLRDRLVDACDGGTHPQLLIRLGYGPDGPATPRRAVARVLREVAGAPDAHPRGLG